MFHIKQINTSRVCVCEAVLKKLSNNRTIAVPNFWINTRRWCEASSTRFLNVHFKLKGRLLGWLYILWDGFETTNWIQLEYQCSRCCNMQDSSGISQWQRVSAWNLLGQCHPAITQVPMVRSVWVIKSQSRRSSNSSTSQINGSCDVLTSDWHVQKFRMFMEIHPQILCKWVLGGDV